MKQKIPKYGVFKGLILWIFLSFMALFAETAAGITIENTAYAQYQDAGGYEYQIQSQTVITIVSEGYRLDISKEVKSSVYLPSDTVMYHINLSNSGNISVSTVTVSDTLSDDLIYISSQPAATVTGQVLSWNLQNIQSGATEGIDLQCCVAPDVASGISIENQAVYITADEVSGQSQLVTFTIESRPDLLIESSVDRPTAYAGDTLTYSITVTNAGNVPATSTLLYSDLPYQTEFYENSGNGQHDNGIVRWMIGTLPVGGSVEETVRVVVNEAVSSGMVLSIFASVTSAEEITASAQAFTQIIERVLQPDLTIRRTNIPTTHPGDTLNYRITYGNIGNSPATDIVLSDSLDDGLIFLSASGLVQYNALSHKFSWSFDTLSNGEEDSVEVFVIVRKGLADGTVLENTAHVICNEDASASVVAYTTVQAPQFTFLKSSDSSAVAAGDEILYTISYRNTGSGAATDVVIGDTLSSNLIYVSSSGLSNYDTESHVVTWDLNSLEANMSSSRSVELVTRTRLPLINGTVISNTANLGCYEGFFVTSSVNMTVKASPDLFIGKSVQSRAYRGDTLTYVIDFGNEGNAVASFTSISDTLPEEIGFITAEGSYSYDPELHCVSWDIRDLSPDTDSTLFIQAVVLDVPMSIVDISNTASIHSQSIHLRSNTAVTDLNAFDLSITADTDTIIGNGTSRSQITVLAKNASGLPVPDGTPISITSTLGTLESPNDTFYTVNGLVQNNLISSVIDQEYVPVSVKATLLDASGVADSITLTFSALRIVGIVTNNDGTTVAGAIVTIILDGEVIGTDTTGTDGIYSIPIYASGNYIIRIQYPDGRGNYNTFYKNLDINVEDSDQSTTVEDLCSISGRLIDYNTDQPINIPNLPIIIDLSDNDGLEKRSDVILPDTTYTDSSGFWYFKDLDPGNYTVSTIFDEDDLYHVGTRKVTINKQGENMINIDLIQRPIIFRIYKTVNRTQAFSGDTLTYSIVYRSTENEVTDTIRIIDQLPEELELLTSTLDYSDAIRSYDYDQITNELIFYRIGMPEESADSLSFKVKIKEGVIVMINNEAVIMSRPDTAYTVDNSRTSAQTMILSPFLAVSKTVNWPVAETGDVLTYSIKIENRSQDQPLYGMTVTDWLPQGFRYKEGRSVLNTESVSDPDMNMSGVKQTLVWTLNDTLTPGANMTMKYRVIVGLESRIGENCNTVMAMSHIQNDYEVWSNIAEAEVIVKPGMLQDRGLIFGKVFYDTNGNDLHDKGEGTLKNIEIITEEGIRVITDEYGKYSIPNVRLGDHVLRINEVTLPANTEIRLSSSDFLGDTRSRLVKVAYSGIAKANFPIKELTGKEQQSHPERKSEREAIIDLTQRSLTQSMRLVVNDSWSMMLQYEYSSEKAMFLLKNHSDIERTVEFLKWQKQLQIEIKERIDLAEESEQSVYKKDHKELITPSYLLLDYLKKNGIMANRIHLAERPEIDKTLCDRIKSCQVELVLLPEEGLYSPTQALTMNHDIRYTGGLPLKQADLLTSIPEGFRIDESSAKLNEKTVRMERTENHMIKWDLSEWIENKDLTLSYDLIPEDPANIRRSSTIISYMKLKPRGGKKLKTNSLNTIIPTCVEMIRFDVTLEGALFDVGSYVLKTQALSSIEKIGNFMLWKTDLTILVEGFTDNTGSAEKNKTLSLNRANAVRDYLVKIFNISPDRIETTGYGEDFPIADNGTAKGRSLNRRVEVIMNANFIQKGKGLDAVLQDDLSLRVEKRKIEILSEHLSQ